MLNVVIADSVFASRAVDLHDPNIVSRNYDLGALLGQVLGRIDGRKPFLNAQASELG